MDSDTGLVVFLFASAAEAERRIAGMSAAGRMAAEACKAGAREIRIAAPTAPALSAALREDLRRGCKDVPVRAIAIHDIGLDAGDALMLKGSHLVSEAALRGFAQSKAAILHANGLVVGARGALADAVAMLGDTTAQTGFEAEGAVSFLPAGTAARQIIRATSKPGDGLVSRWLNRPLSQFISGMVLHVPGVRPWHLTFIVGLAALAMFACFVSGTAGGIIAGGLLFHAASVLDGVDGEVARATLRSSPAGAFLDTAVDIATNFLFYIGLTMGLARLNGEIHLWVGGWTVLCALAGLLILSWLIRRLGRSGSFDILKLYYRHIFPTGIPRLIVETLVTMTSRDFFAFAFALIIVAGGAAAVSWILAGFASLWIFLVLAAAPGLCRGADGPWRRRVTT